MAVLLQQLEGSKIRTGHASEPNQLRLRRTCSSNQFKLVSILEVIEILNEDVEASDGLDEHFNCLN